MTTNRTCPLCFAPAILSGSIGRRSGYVLQCSSVKSHKLTQGRDVTHVTMRGTDGKVSMFAVVRTMAYRYRGSEVVDMTNVHEVAKAWWTRADGDVNEWCAKLVAQHAISWAPAFAFAEVA